jgi:UDP-glucose 4-epimerase
MITKHSIPVEIKNRRSGDPAILIASSDKAKQVLNWQPQFDSIEQIIRDAWNWHRNNPNGYNPKN